MKRPLIVPALMLGLLAVACEPATSSRGAVANPASGAITINADGDRLLIAAEDHDQLLVVDRESLEVESRIDVGDAPFHVIEVADRGVLTSNRYDHTVSLVDAEAGTVKQTFTVGVSLSAWPSSMRTPSRWSSAVSPRWPC